MLLRRIGRQQHHQQQQQPEEQQIQTHIEKETQTSIAIMTTTMTSSNSNIIRNDLGGDDGNDGYYHGTGCEKDDNITVPKVMPRLAYSEVTLGRVVGRGGFSVVSEILSVDLQEVYDVDDDTTAARHALGRMVNHHHYQHQRGSTTSISSSTGVNSNDELIHNSNSNGSTSSSSNMKYVLKTLRTDLPEDEHIKGVMDLAIEAEFLSVLQHPNIITMSATANTDPHQNRFFVVLERLSQTLERRFNYWRKIVGENSGWWIPCVGIYCCPKAPALYQTWKERLIATRDMSRAIQFLHNSGIIYRDLKPDNIGFNQHGLVQIFDFGLAKRLADVEKANDGTDAYLLTGNTGSLRYMAPEVALDLPYTTSVDVYSFGILFWQICSLITPFAGYNQKTHAERVIRQGQRPKPDTSWPQTWIQLQKQCWNHEPTTRPNFTQITNELEELVDDMIQDEDVIPTNRSSSYSALRAKKRKKKVKPNHSATLDVDTRLASVPVDMDADATAATTHHDNHAPRDGDNTNTGVVKRYENSVV